MARSRTSSLVGDGCRQLVLGLFLGAAGCSGDSMPSSDAAAGSAGTGGAAIGQAGANSGGSMSVAGSDLGGGAGQGAAGAGEDGGAAGNSGNGSGGVAGSAGEAGAGLGGGTSGAGGDAGSLSCRNGTYGQRTYLVCPHAGMDRAAASDYCQQRGMQLLALGSAEEESWAYEFVTEPGSIWLGAQDIDQEGEWKWPDGSAASDGYTNWADGQPNNSGLGEDCAVLHSGLGKWNDVACDVTSFDAVPLSIICEP